MKGLFIYDVINLKSYSKIFLILAAFFMIYAIGTKSPSYFSGMLFMLFAMLPVSSLAMDEKSGWDKYIATLPVKKTYYVAEKYLLFIILDLAAVFVTFILSFILSIGIQETIITLVSMFCVCMLFESLILPFVFKFGAEKARYIMFFVFLIPFILTFLLSKLHININIEKIESILFIIPFLILIMFIVSLMLSSEIYRKKEF